MLYGYFSENNKIQCTLLQTTNARQIVPHEPDMYTNTKIYDVVHRSFYRKRVSCLLTLARTASFPEDVEAEEGL